MDDWHTKGCDACRQGVLSARWPPPERIGVIDDLHAFVHRCSECQAFWLFNEREAHVVSDAEVPAMLGQMAPLEGPADSPDITKQVRNTKDRRKVDDIHRMSIAGVNVGDVSEERNWDPNSCWQNSRFTHKASGMQWVVYLADNAWPGEVKVLSESRPLGLLGWTPKAT